MKYLLSIFTIPLFVLGWLVAPAFPPQVAYAATETIFEDGFESENFSEWSQNENFEVVEGDSAEGDFHAEATEAGGESNILAKEVSTENHDDIMLTFEYKLLDLDSGDSVLIQYMSEEAGEWITFDELDEEDEESDWTEFESDLPADADDNEDFAFRFFSELESESVGEFHLDDVQLTGMTDDESGEGGEDDENGDEGDEDELNVQCKVSHETIDEGENVTFEAEVSGGDSPFEFEWSGDTDEIEDFDEDEQEQTVTIDDSGDYEIEVTVTDDDGRSDSDDCPTITVEGDEDDEDENGDEDENNDEDENDEDENGDNDDEDGDDEDRDTDVDDIQKITVYTDIDDDRVGVEVDTESTFKWFYVDDGDEDEIIEDIADHLGIDEDDAEDLVEFEDEPGDDDN